MGRVSAPFFWRPTMDKKQIKDLIEEIVESRVEEIIESLLDYKVEEIVDCKLDNQLETMVRDIMEEDDNG